MALRVMGPLLLPVVVYCGVHAWRDFTRGKTVWAIAGVIALACAVAVLLIPIPTHAVKYDLVP